jgi:hypothetical protein
MEVMGDEVRLVEEGKNDVFEISEIGFRKNEIDVKIISKYKSKVKDSMVEEKDGEFRVEFKKKEVGSNLVEV